MSVAKRNQSSHRENAGREPRAPGFSCVRLALCLSLVLMVVVCLNPGTGFCLGTGIFSAFAEQGELDRLPNQRFALTSMHLVEGDEVDAIIANLTLSYQGSSWFSGRFNIPYITSSRFGSQTYDFGDLTIRFLGRIRGNQDSTSAASLYTVLRIPTGAEALYPFATSALDFEAGARAWLALSDLELSLGGSWVSRGDPGDASVYFDELKPRLQAGASLGVKFGDRQRVEIGGYGEWFRGGERRATLHASYRFPLAGRSSLILRSAAQLGEENQILYDYSLGLGVLFFFPRLGEDKVKDDPSDY